MTGGAQEGIAQDRASYVTLMQKLRDRIGGGKLLTITGAAGNWVLDVGFNLDSLTSLVDWY